MKWGAGSCLLPFGAGVYSDAKQDSVFLSYSGSTNIETDLSQEATDLTAVTGSSNIWAYEVSSSRANIPNTARNISARFDYTGGNSGVLVSNGQSSSDFFWNVFVNVNGQVICSERGISNLNVTLPYTGALARTYAFQWSSRVNPLSSSASDAIVHELRILDEATGEYTGSFHTTSSLTGSNNDAFSIGAYHNGASIFPDMIRRVHLGTDFRPGSEFRVDYGTTTQKAQATYDALGFRDPLAAERTAGMGDEGEYAGPTWAMAADFQNNRHLRLESPVWNQAYRADSLTQGFATTTITSSLQLAQPNHSDWTMWLNFRKMFALPSDTFVDHFHVKLHVSCSRACDFRMICMNKDPVPQGIVNDPQEPSFDQRYLTLSASAGPQYLSGNLVMTRRESGANAFTGFMVLASSGVARFIVDSINVMGYFRSGTEEDIPFGLKSP